VADTLTGTFGKPFKEAVAAFRLRLGNLVPTAKWDDLWQDQHDRAFMVAGATKADLLADLAAAVDKAISQGTSLEEFRRDFRRIVEERGWHGWTGEGTKAGEAWRTRVIYRTNMRTSYAAGRMAQLVEGGFSLWVYRHGGSVEPRIIHLGWDGLVLPPDHPFWATHAPPNGWGCSCYVVGARSFAGAQRLGGQPGKPLPDGWQKLDPKTGAPVGIDKGWAYAPGRSAARTIQAVAQKVTDLPAPTGASLLNEWPDKFFGAWAETFAEFIDETQRDVERGRWMVVGGLKPLWVAKASEAGVMPATSEIVVRERDIRHTFRDSKTATLDPAWYRNLPVHLRQPDAVILDPTREGAPALLLVFNSGASSPKLVIQINYRLKKVGEFNVVETGKVIDPTGMLQPGMVIIEGGL
jgi:hypothetical protein